MKHLENIDNILKNMTRQDAESICVSIKKNFGNATKMVFVASPAHEKNHQKYKQVRDELSKSMATPEVPWFDYQKKFDAPSTASTCQEITDAIFQQKAKA